MKSTRHKNNLISIPQFECEICKKKYTNDKSLFRHKKLCTSKKQSEENLKLEQLSEIREKIRNELMEELNITNLTNINHTTNHIIANQITNNNNNHIHIYLNQYCNDAPNILDTIKNMEFTEYDFREINNRSVPLNIAMYNLFVAKFTEMPVEKRSLHCDSKMLFVRDENKWKEEDPVLVKQQIEDVEEFDDDTDMEDVPEEYRPGIKKMVMTKTTEQFGDKVYDSCEEIFSDKKILENVHKDTRIAKNCTNRGYLAENLTKSKRLHISPLQSQLPFRVCI
jgi:hypothetical protein